MSSRVIDAGLRLGGYRHADGETSDASLPAEHDGSRFEVESGAAGRSQ